jgi:hypothetical protein
MTLRRKQSRQAVIMRRSAIVVIPLLLLMAGEASAHAFLDHAEPRVGNKVPTPPREVTGR